MRQEITLEQFRHWLIQYADRIAEREAYLTELDAAIGDADHGTNMQRGMRKVRERLADASANWPDVGSLFRAVAMLLISNVGGAAGPLYGAFFLHAAQSAAQGGTKREDTESSVTLQQLAKMFRSGLEGVQYRGKAAVGEKTMVDALHPAVQALEQAVAEGRSLANALRAARSAADSGMKHTIELEASKGRASYLGPRSIGHQDPGATSSFYLIETAAEMLGGASPQQDSANLVQQQSR